MGTRNFCDPTSSSHNNSGGLHVKKKATRSQLRALATHTPILGGVAQGTLELGLSQIRKCHFLSDPCLFWMYLLRKDAYKRLFTYHLKAHTISNKMVSKVSAQKKGGGLWQLQICVQISEVWGRIPPCHRHACNESHYSTSPHYSRHTCRSCLSYSWMQWISLQYFPQYSRHTCRSYLSYPCMQWTCALETFTSYTHLDALLAVESLCYIQLLRIVHNGFVVFLEVAVEECSA